MDIFYLIIVVAIILGGPSLLIWYTFSRERWSQSVALKGRLVAHTSYMVLFLICLAYLFHAHMNCDELGCTITALILFLLSPAAILSLSFAIIAIVDQKTPPAIKAKSVHPTKK